jgi:hypothetical protein
MSGDYSRYGFDPRKDVVSVLLQQGRPLTDRDWNEAAMATARRIQAGSYDTLGQAVYPASTPHAFALSFDAAGNLQIGSGRMYVDGLLVENHGTEPLVWDPALAESRGAPTPYLPSAPSVHGMPYMPNPPTLPRPGAPAIAYLDVWEREVTQYEDAFVLEPALGVDTTTRRQIAWQVKFLPTMPADTTCATDLSKNPAWTALVAPSSGRLSTPPPSQVPGQADPCIIPPASGYTGLENQLYRVEIQTGGVPGAATFKWSRDNASVMARVTQVIDLSHIVVDSVGKDNVLRFSDGDWIEITDNWREFAGLPGDLRRIKVGGGVDDATRVITLDSPIDARLFPTTSGGQLDRSRHTRIRRWDQQGKVLDSTGALYADLGAAGSTGAITVPTGDKTLLLENGVLVTFSVEPADGAFKPGDYWVFVARASDGTVERLSSAPPRGIHHHYAKLAVVTFPNTVQDCRVPWPPARGEFGGCCTVTVSPQQLAGGTTLQSILDQYDKQDQITVCLMPGNYDLAEPLVLGPQHSNLTLEGCHQGVVIQAAPGSEAKFLDGLIVIATNRHGTPSGISLRGLTFSLPLVPFLDAAHRRLAGLSVDILERMGGPKVSTLQELIVSIGVRAVKCSTLAIEDCSFLFNSPGSVKNLFAVGVFASSGCDGLRVSGNRLKNVGKPTKVQIFNEPFQLSVGYLLAPAEVINEHTHVRDDQYHVEAVLERAWLDHACFHDNLFTGLGAALLIEAETGDLAFRDNVVQNCYAGILVIARHTPPDLPDTPSTKPIYQDLLGDPVLQIGSALARGYPLPAAFTDDNAKLVSAEVPLNTLPFRDAPLFNGFNVLLQLLFSLEKAPEGFLGLKLVLRFADNNIQAVLSDTSHNFSGAGLLIWGSGRDPTSKAIVSASYVENNAPPFLPTMTLAELAFFTLSGNHVFNNNDASQTVSLALLGDSEFAITGNIFQGDPNPALLADWLSVNVVL